MADWLVIVGKTGWGEGEDGPDTGPGLTASVFLVFILLLGTKVGRGDLTEAEGKFSSRRSRLFALSIIFCWRWIFGKMHRG